jgi:hypothetical protein
VPLSNLIMWQNFGASGKIHPPKDA